MASTIKVDTIDTPDGTGNITVSRPLSGSGASLTSLPAANLTGSLPAISGASLTGITGNIAFPATQSASADANTLDDYEEGDWTPVLSDGSNNATAAANNSGKYTKIGRTVFISAYVSPSSMGSVSGNLRVTGLPFTANSDGSTQGGVHANYGYYLTITAGESVTCYVQQATTYINVSLYDWTEGVTALQVSEFVNGAGTLGDLILGGHYFV
jgi:hypothetical protein